MVAKDSEPRQTLATTVYEAIRLDIIEGRCRPGEKLLSEALRDRYGAGISPIREALSRLHSEGWVLREEQRGFRVAEISRAELLELIRTRVLVEGLAVQEAIARQEVEAEEALVLAFHRMGKVQRYLPGDHPERNLEWETRHRAFHMALIAGCRSKWLVQFCAQLFDMAERYRLVAATVYPERKEREEHREIMEAYLHGDAAGVRDLLARHYQTTVDFILQCHFSGDAKP